jgi:hypothetical protein
MLTPMWGWVAASEAPDSSKLSRRCSSETFLTAGHRIRWSLFRGRDGMAVVPLPSFPKRHKYAPLPLFDTSLECGSERLLRHGGPKDGYASRALPPDYGEGSLCSPAEYASNAS